MKKYFKPVIFALIVLLVGCSEADETKNSSAVVNPLVSEGRQFARIHNECLDEIYGNIVTVSSRTDEMKSRDLDDLKREIIDAANRYVGKYVSQNTRNTDSDSVAYITDGDFSLTTLEDIQSSLSTEEKHYIEMYTGEDVNKGQLLEEIATDVNIEEDNRLALICFLATYDASSEYWSTNYSDWVKILDQVSPSTRGFRFNLKKVAFADAWWAYQGLLASGLNVYVGGGAAAVGSAFACLE